MSLNTIEDIVCKYNKNPNVDDGCWIKNWLVVHLNFSMSDIMKHSSILGIADLKYF